MKLVLVVIRLTLGGLFLWSGLAKAREPYEFLGTVYSYQVVGPTTGIITAAWVPWLEIVIGGCLVAGLFVEGAFLVAMMLTATFAVAIGSALYRGLGISCGCFGTSTAPIDRLTLARSLAVLLTATGGLVITLGTRRPSRRSLLDGCFQSGSDGRSLRRSRHSPAAAGNDESMLRLWSRATGCGG